MRVIKNRTLEGSDHYNRNGYLHFLQLQRIVFKPRFIVFVFSRKIYQKSDQLNLIVKYFQRG